MFKHKLGRYEKITALNTDSGDHEIHEHVVVKGSTARINSIMDHHAFPSIESFVEKHNRYSNWEAVIESSSIDNGKKLQHETVNGKRRLRRIFRKLPFRPTFVFLLCLHLAGGNLGWVEWICFCEITCPLRVPHHCKSKSDFNQWQRVAGVIDLI